MNHQFQLLQKRLNKNGLESRISYRIASYYHQLFLMWYSNRDKGEGGTLLDLIKKQLQWNPESTAGLSVDQPSDKVIQQKIQSAVIVSLLEQYLFFVPIVQQGRRFFLMTNSHQHAARELEKKKNVLKQLLWSFECVLQLAMFHNADVKQRYFKKAKKYLPNGKDIPEEGLRTEEYWKKEMLRIEGFTPTGNIPELPEVFSLSDTEIDVEQPRQFVSSPNRRTLKSRNSINNESVFVEERHQQISLIENDDNNNNVVENHTEQSDDETEDSLTCHLHVDESINTPPKRIRKVQIEKRAKTVQDTGSIPLSRLAKKSASSHATMTRTNIVSKERLQRQYDPSSKSFSTTKKRHFNGKSFEKVSAFKYVTLCIKILDQNEQSKEKGASETSELDSLKKDYLAILENDKTKETILRIREFMCEAFDMYESFMKRSRSNLNESEKKQKQEEIFESYSQLIFQCMNNR